MASDSAKAATPGWNDPPMLDHGVKDVVPKSRISNRRVAFPLQPPGAQQQQSNLTRIPSAAVSTPALPDKKPAAGDPSLVLDKLVENFEKVLSEISDEAKVRDVRNKIGVLEKMWSEDTLTDGIKDTLCELSEHIAEGNYEEANRLHLKLVVEHATLCAPWIVGIKHLIHKVKQK